MSGDILHLNCGIQVNLLSALDLQSSTRQVLQTLVSCLYTISNQQMLSKSLLTLNGILSEWRCNALHTTKIRSKAIKRHTVNKLRERKNRCRRQRRMRRLRRQLGMCFNLKYYYS